MLNFQHCVIVTIRKHAYRIQLSSSEYSPAIIIANYCINHLDIMPIGLTSYNL